MKTKDLVLTAMFAALTAIGAFLRVATPISSFTLQFFFTCMAAVLLGSRLGAMSQIVYVALGLVGLPIFTKGGGFSYVLEPTFGFLLGLIPAAFVIGLVVEKRGASAVSIVLACLAGLVVLYVVGLPYMYGILNVYLGKPITILQTIQSGMLLFLPWEFLKIAVTAILGTKLVPVLRRQTSC